MGSQENIFEPENEGDAAGRDAAIPSAAADHFDRNISDESETDPVSNRKRQWHSERGNHGRCALRYVTPVDVGQASRHQARDEEQGGGGRISRHSLRQWRKEKARQKEQATDHGSEPGPAAGLHAGGAFDIAGRR